MIGATVRQLIEDAGFSAWLTEAPEAQPLPYVIVFELIGDSASRRGDDADIERLRELQVDLWEDVEDEPSSSAATLRALLADVDLTLTSTRARLETLGRDYDDEGRAIRTSFQLRLHYPSSQAY